MYSFSVNYVFIQFLVQNPDGPIDKDCACKIYFMTELYTVCICDQEALRGVFGIQDYLYLQLAASFSSLSKMAIKGPDS